IEDEAPIRKHLRSALEQEGYRLVEAENGRQGLAHATNQPPDLVILDLGLPDIDGLDVIRRVREWSRMPIVILSARGQERDKVAALDAGADDYVTKPFGVGELLARLRVALRHASRADDVGQGEATVIEIGELKLDLAARRAFLRGQDLRLTPIEYRLLTTLARHGGKVLTHRFLLKEVWGPGAVDEVHYLRVHTANLRRKIEADPARPRYLLTEQGVGYRFADV
ncbi:MAG: response regulator, partial [Phycisphaerae bacterium]|nr:response regulator [Phycisphaerae bacterium]